MESKASAKRENLSLIINGYQVDLMDGFRLQKLAKSLHRSYENECNYGLTPRQETRERNLWEQVEALASTYGIYVQEQGDPRGWPIIMSKTPIDESRGSSCDRVCPY
jgi:hypothetical protein